MHKQFAAWLRDAGLEPNDETSPKHWEVISEYLPNPRKSSRLLACFMVLVAKRMHLWTSSEPLCRT